jgi:hypothetical protein
VLLSIGPIKKAYRNMLPFYVAAIALIAPLRGAYSLLKKYHAVPPWNVLTVNTFVLTFQILDAAVRSIIFGLVFSIPGVALVNMAVSYFGDYSDNEDIHKSVTKWSFYIPAAFLFSIQLILILGDSAPNILNARLPSSDFDSFPRWSEALIGGIVLIPCYIFLFRRVRRWLRATFPSDPKDVKDILA